MGGWGRERSSIRTSQVLVCAEREQQRHKHSRDVWSWTAVGETSDTSSVAVGSWESGGRGGREGGRGRDKATAQADTVRRWRVCGEEDEEGDGGGEGAGDVWICMREMKHDDTLRC